MDIKCFTADEYMAHLVALGRRSISGFKQEEKLKAAQCFLEDHNADLAEISADILTYTKNWDDAQKLRQGFLDVCFKKYKDRIEEIFDDAISEYRLAHPYAIKIDYDDWRDQDNNERYRGIA